MQASRAFGALQKAVFMDRDLKMETKCSVQWRIQGGAWGAQAPPLALGTDFYAQDYNH